MMFPNPAIPCLFVATIPSGSCQVFSFLNLYRLCPEVGLTSGAPGSVSRPLYHSPVPTIQVTRRSKWASTPAHITQGTLHPRVPSASCLQMVISVPALRRIQCTTWCRGTPALLALAIHAFNKFLRHKHARNNTCRGQGRHMCKACKYN